MVIEPLLMVIVRHRRPSGDVGVGRSSLGGVKRGMGGRVRVGRMIAAFGAVALASSVTACAGPAGQQAQGGYELPTSTPKATTVQVAQRQQAPPGGRWLSGASGDKAAKGAFG